MSTLKWFNPGGGYDCLAKTGKWSLLVWLSSGSIELGVYRIEIRLRDILIDNEDLKPMPVERGQREGKERAEAMLDALVRPAAVALGIAPAGAPKLCAICTKPAACIGRSGERTPGAYACGECCGHGLEDGRCDLLEKGSS